MVKSNVLTLTASIVVYVLTNTVLLPCVFAQDEADSSEGVTEAIQDPIIPAVDAADSGESPTTQDEVSEKFQVPGWLIEQSIYIPFEKIKDKFEATGRGVYIPYEQFDQLWQLAQKNAKPEVEPQAPFGYALVSSDSQAELERALVRIRSQLVIDFMQEGWHRVPLALQGCAMMSAEVAGEPARLIKNDDGSFSLLYQATTADTRIELQLTYVKSVPEGSGENRLQWPVPQAVVNRWEISMNQPDVDISVTPAVVTSSKGSASNKDDPQATAADQEIPDAADPKVGISTVTALLGDSPTINLRWTPRSVGAEGLEALLTAQSNIVAEIQRHVLRLQHGISLNIQRASITEVELAIPENIRIVNVLSESVKRWQVDDEQNRLQVELFEAMQGTLNLQIEMEQELEGDPQQKRELQLTPLEVVAATRQPGSLVIKGESGLRVELDSISGLSRVNEVRDRTGAADPVQMTFRYSSVPWQINFSLTEWSTLVTAQQQVLSRLEPLGIESNTLLLLDIKQKGIFQIPLVVPTELEILDVRGGSHADHTPVQVEKHERSTTQPEQVIVQLQAEAIGPVAVLIRTRQEVPSPGLVDAAADPLAIALRWPGLQSGFAQSVQGRLLLTAPDSLNVVMDGQTIKKLRNVDPIQLFPEVTSPAQRFAYEFVAEDADLNFKAVLRKPRVFVDQVTTVSVESGLLRYNVELDYDIRFSPLRDLRLDVPAATEDRIRIVGGALNHQRMTPQPDDVAPGFIAWRLSGAAELLGSQKIQLGWDVPIPDIAIGARQNFSVSTVVPKSVERDRGQLVFRRSELFDVQLGAEAEGLRPIDPSTDLFGGRRIDDAVAALEYVGPWSIQLDVARYELYDLKRSNIPRSLIRAVWLRSDQVSVQAVYRMRSVNQRIVINMPPGFDPNVGFDSAPVRIDGQTIALERGAGGELIIPLGNRDREQELLMEVRYTMPILDSEIPVPTFAEDCAVQKAVLVLYLPHDWAPLSFTGPWSDRLLEDDTSLWDRLTRRWSKPKDDPLNWIATEGESVRQLREFETDGRAYSFTTINPAPGSDGALRVVKTNGWIVQAIGAIVILLSGVLLVRYSWTMRLIVIATLFGMWILALSLWPLVVTYLDYQGVVWVGLLILGLWFVTSILSFFSQSSRSFNTWLWTRTPTEDAREERAAENSRSRENAVREGAENEE